MILSRRHNESWMQAALRFGMDAGVDGGALYDEILEDTLNYGDERTSAYLALAGRGLVDGVEAA